MKTGGSRQSRRQNQRQNDPETGNRRELSNHSFSSRCRAWWRTAALGQYGGRKFVSRQRVWKSRSAMLPPWISLAAGRHHITNFDADSARDAAFSPVAKRGESVFEVRMRG